MLRGKCIGGTNHFLMEFIILHIHIYNILVICY